MCVSKHRTQEEGWSILPPCLDIAAVALYISPCRQSALAAEAECMHQSRISSIWQYKFRSWTTKVGLFFWRFEQKFCFANLLWIHCRYTVVDCWGHRSVHTLKSWCKQKCLCGIWVINRPRHFFHGLKHGWVQKKRKRNEWIQREIRKPDRNKMSLREARYFIVWCFWKREYLMLELLICPEFLRTFIVKVLQVSQCDSPPACTSTNTIFIKSLLVQGLHLHE